MKTPESVAALLLRALQFSAEKHRHQRRKDAASSPYINHPIEVADTLATAGAVTDPDILVAAILHDTVEDTLTTTEELERHFGPVVRRLVDEVTDDKSLPKEERKRLQIEHTPEASAGAKMIKMADKICNIREIADTPPKGWSPQRRMEYLDWTEAVVAGCRGVNEPLERLYEETAARVRRALGDT